MKAGFWDSEANKFTLYGAVFGLLFPIIATVIQSYVGYGTLNWTTIVAVQSSDPLLWIIDSAPFFLGLFARFAGWRQDQLKRIIQKSMSNVELEEDRLENARQFAGVLTFLGVALIGIVLLLVIFWLQSLLSAPPVEVAATTTVAQPISAESAPTATAAPQVVLVNATTPTELPTVPPTPAPLPTVAAPTPLPTALPALPTDPPSTVAPVVTQDGIRLGVVERSEVSCDFFTEVARLSWQATLGIEVLIERFATIDELYEALADADHPQAIDLTFCYLDPTDRAYLRQYAGSLNIVGNAIEQIDNTKLFALRSRFTPAIDQSAQRCINNFLNNQSYPAPAELTLPPADWLAANTDVVTAWLDCATVP